jgi:tRNA-2-methylthio-N6-dimethylallyladenosine synthase
VTAGGRTYQIRTYGCQMNAHDSERLAGLLDKAGYQPAGDGETPDVVVFNTCAVRENAADRLYGNLGHLLPQKKNGMQIAVGGCLAQMERTRIIQRAPWVDVVYGTHNMGSLPALLARARVRNEAQAEFAETLDTFPSLLPARRQSAYAAWVAISVGCNNTCTFCIVPSLRGKEKDRRPGDILGEIRALVADGVLEVTLLGQNVNSYGAEFGDRNAFGKLLRGCGEIEGLERVRFTSPHPRDFTDDVIDAMAQTPNVMPSLHMPLQSGSDRILKAMRRAYRRDRYLAILDRVRASIPDAAITTDIIVGFPGETEEDFADTLDLVRQARFAGAFTFRYSIRPGTPAATMDDQIPAEVVQERYERLTALVEETTYAENRKQAGTTVEVLVAEGEGRKDAATHRMSGRARDNRLVHFTPGPTTPDQAAPIQATPRPGDVVTVTVTRGAPHYLLSDAVPLSVRRTRAGDAWEAAAATPAAATPAAATPAQVSAAPVSAAPVSAAAPVLLGMPARHSPATMGTLGTLRRHPGPGRHPKVDMAGGIFRRGRGITAPVYDGFARPGRACGARLRRSSSGSGRHDKSLPRPRLAERLDQAVGRGLVLVCAPAGYGKTSLLASWAGTARSRWRGCRWTRATMPRRASGAMRWPRWTRSAPGSAIGWAAAGAAGPAVVRGAGNGPDQRTGRPVRIQRRTTGAR